MINFDSIEFIKKEEKFLADPIGITHLDMINRALDIAQLAIRKILYDAMNAREHKRKQVNDNRKIIRDQR